MFLKDFFWDVFCLFVFQGVKRSKALSQKRKDKLLLKETERMRKIENEKTHKLVKFVVFWI